jgi:hypothetical protein
MSRVSVIIPVFYDSEKAEQLCKEISSCLDASLDKEFILPVIFSGADAVSVESAEERNNNVDSKSKNKKTIKTIEYNRKFDCDGEFVSSALKIADSDYSVVFYPEGGYPFTSVEKLISPLKNNKADVVVGTRFSGLSEHMVVPSTFFILNRLSTFFSNVLSGIAVDDVGCNIFAARTGILKALPFEEKRPFLSLELIAKLSGGGYIFYEVSLPAEITFSKKWGMLKNFFLSISKSLIYFFKGTSMLYPEALKEWRRISCGRIFGRNIAHKIRPYLGKSNLFINASNYNVMFNLNGHNLKVVDSSPEAVEFFNSIKPLGFSGEAFFLPDVFDGNFADLAGAVVADDNVTIVAGDVLAKVENDEDFLAGLANLLGENGKIISWLPQYSLFSSNLDKAAGYLRRYNKLSARSLFARNGFEVECVKDVNFPALPFFILAGKILQKNNLSPKWLRLFDLLAWCGQVLSFIPLPGLYLMVVAYKRRGL